MNLLKKTIERIKGVKHPNCTYCGKVIEGISYIGNATVVGGTRSCGCNKPTPKE